MLCVDNALSLFIFVKKEVFSLVNMEKECNFVEHYLNNKDK